MHGKKVAPPNSPPASSPLVARTHLGPRRPMTSARRWNHPHMAALPRCISLLVRSHAPRQPPSLVSAGTERGSPPPKDVCLRGRGREPSTIALCAGRARSTPASHTPTAHTNSDRTTNRNDSTAYNLVYKGDEVLDLRPAQQVLIDCTGRRLVLGGSDAASAELSLRLQCPRTSASRWESQRQRLHHPRLGHLMYTNNEYDTALSSEWLRKTNKNKPA